MFISRSGREVNSMTGDENSSIKSPCFFSAWEPGGAGCGLHSQAAQTGMEKTNTAPHHSPAPGPRGDGDDHPGLSPACPFGTISLFLGGKRQCSKAEFVTWSPVPLRFHCGWSVCLCIVSLSPGSPSPQVKGTRGDRGTSESPSKSSQVAFSLFKSIPRTMTVKQL